ncbi:hypothetical protein IU449_16235 [Nocardia higoensis]|uniref:Uncharacterized protein n=1 Tax=Nocardia higoensis TaxID=228599 RepID=A0ABS0DC67_9NOCA|nr:hypothetical protein [Nocardia higoensis]MBF6356071.1 hypothetical protein [Nocardia higoensis]
MTAREPVAAQEKTTEQQVPADQGKRRRKRVDLYALSPNQMTLFEQEDTER